ncbi:uncharacterized membrane protein YheB (UPF0754 family) [Thermovibrio guaymasensis]|uniref:Uncharacterized membrane protein YheB (UPF0754 family) n=1 Tax=Thermovibrio guaymasensis TaxID=240167 RepID=A0A420W6E7_9BACT|nr:DUF445 family protein [Thermovibrio guaymasensis]RKQ61655.1 uncharacterized membrane protein YheB (UPF0754 family) [Thermovibrio guaymasensis]
MIEYIVPPTVGALIGYFTNYIAIKMLFKPVKPYYLFGKKVPFTPGLIPAKREKLAEAIAKVVKENLLTEESIKRRLNHSKVRESLLNFTENFLSELSRNSSLYVKQFIEKVEDKKLKNVIPQELVDQKAEQLIEKGFRKLHGRSLRELLPDRVERELERTLNEKLDKFTESLIEQLRSGQLREVIYTAVMENVSKLQSVLPLITQRFAQTIAHKATQLIEEMVERVANEPSFRLKLSKLLWTKFQTILSSGINTESELAVKLKEILKTTVREYLREIEGKRIKELSTLKELLVEELPPFISSFIESHKREIAQLLAEKLFEVIERELPVIMEAINVEEMVKERVNSLPIEEVEEIVLKLIDEELKHITLLGGVLGFIIGLTQILFI